MMRSIVSIRACRRPRWAKPVRRLVRAAAMLAFGTSLGSCHDRTDSSFAAPAATLPKATCQIGDRPEAALQGQVPAALRRAGAFAGFHCNLTLVSQRRDEGAGWQSLFFRDRAGHLCAYYDTAPTRTGRAHAGVVVVDATDASNVHPTAYLTTPAMLDPMETLKVNQRRQLLVALHSVGPQGQVALDAYDLSVDCRSPRLVSAQPQGAAATAGSVRANEGNFSPDGLTYYATSLRDGIVRVIDMRNPEAPNVIAQWSMPFNQRTSGLAIGADGNRAYFTLYGQGSAADAASKSGNGLVIVDVSDVQARKPDPQPRVIGSIVWGDGSASHQIVPVRIEGRQYLVATDEGGSGYANAAGWKASCDAGLPAWNMARIIDIGDEAQPRIVAKLQLEMNDPAHCSEVLPDLTGLGGFTYGSHYCSVDDANDATAIACAYLESGVRVFDIRNPARPGEIAYFVPPSVTSPSPGSLNNQTVASGRPDHCSAQARFDAKDRTLMTTCQDNGFLVMKFAEGVWPLPHAARSARPEN